MDFPPARRSVPSSFQVWRVLLPGLLLTLTLAWGVPARPVASELAVPVHSRAVVTVNAASYVPHLAPGAIAAVFGTRLTEQSQIAESAPLPTVLNGLGVRLVDSHNNIFSAALFFISPGQINYLVPDQIAPGEARIFIINETDLIAQGTLFITNSAPALFTFSANGKGAPTALTTDDGENFFSVIKSDGTLRTLRPSTSRKTNYLLLFGTGFRYARKLRVMLGELEIKPVYAGAQGLLAGLDQINLALPPEAPGGLVNLQVISDGYASNPVQLQMPGK